MATKATEKENVTGLDMATDRKNAEFDLVKNLLEAADFKTSEDSISPVDIKRGGKYLFTVHIHPLSDADLRMADKKAAIMGDNPAGKKFPKIQKDYDNSVYKSWLIYLATTEEDQKLIWGNPAIMQKFSLMQPYESIDKLLTIGEKKYLMDIISEISGLNDAEEEEEMDVETFLD